MEFFEKQLSSGSQEDGMNRKSKIQKNINEKPLGFRLCVIVSAWVYVGVGVCMYVL